ncbi:MAG: DUF481 domain-containing protein [Deltaproteobacteria bacterium]|nr:DUF481 domain-containing protein [Deltaproteobacteria bacterium]
MRHLALTLALLPSLALAQAPAAAAPAVEAAPAPAAVGAAELKATLEAMKEASQATREAAEATREASAQLKTALEAHAAKGEKPAAAEAKPEEKKDEKVSAFSYQLGLGLIAVSGNANAVTGKISGGAEGDWESWKVKLMAAAAYGQTTAATTDLVEVTALNANLSLRGDRKVSKMFSIYLLTGVSADHIASIEAAGLGEAGASLTWWETKNGEDFVKSRFSTDLGFRFTHESRFQYFPAHENLDNVDIYSPRLALSLRYALTKTAVFTEEAEILPDLVNTKNLRATSTSTLTAQLGGGVSLNAALQIRYIGDPAEGKKSTDTELSAGVAWAF